MVVLLVAVFYGNSCDGGRRRENGGLGAVLVIVTVC